MLLRRITEHIKAQNWFAVGIDFIIVVVGVFIGIQVANWNDSRAMNAREIGYLERIHNDLGVDIQNYDYDLTFRQTVEEAGEIALSAKGSLGNAKEDWHLLRAFFNASQMSGRPNIDTTYAELTSSGEIALITNVDLREGLARYYTVAGTNPALQGQPTYRETVRGMIPADIQRILWRDCYRADGDAFQEFIACEPNVDADIVRHTVERMTSSQRLHDELNFWMSTQHVAAIILKSHRNEAERMRSMISAELGGKN